MVVSLLRTRLLTISVYRICRIHKILNRSVEALALHFVSWNLYQQNHTRLANPRSRRVPKPRDIAVVLTPWWKRKGICFLGVPVLLIVRIQRVPYSERFHLAVCNVVANKLSDRRWKSFLKSEEKYCPILPPSDPRVVCVESIAARRIQAMNSALMLKQDWTVNGKERILLLEGHSLEVTTTTTATTSSGGVTQQPQPQPEPQNAVQISSPNLQQHLSDDRKLIWRPSTKHLKKQNWEFYVMHSYRDNAVCINNRIVLYSGTLDTFKSDSEIATVVGHEIGHAVARHVEEDLIRMVLILGLCLPVLDPHLIPLIEKIMIFFSRRREAEADYIGLMLMTSAGYDPRVAPQVYKNLGGEGGWSSTHPSGAKRAQLLNRKKVMDMAVGIYREAILAAALEVLLRKIVQETRIYIGFLIRRVLVKINETTYPIASIEKLLSIVLLIYIGIDFG